MTRIFPLLALSFALLPLGIASAKPDFGAPTISTSFDEKKPAPRPTPIPGPRGDGDNDG